MGDPTNLYWASNARLGIALAARGGDEGASAPASGITQNDADRRYRRLSVDIPQADIDGFDAAVNALVLAQAREGDTSRWPKSKLPTDTVYGATAGVGDTLPSTGVLVNDYFLLRRGYTVGTPPNTTDFTPGLYRRTTTGWFQVAGPATVILTQSEVDGRIRRPARIGNISRWGKTKLPADTLYTASVNTAALANATRWPKSKLPADTAYTGALGSGDRLPATGLVNDYFLLRRGYDTGVPPNTVAILPGIYRRTGTGWVLAVSAAALSSDTTTRWPKSKLPADTVYTGAVSVGDRLPASGFLINDFFLLRRGYTVGTPPNTTDFTPGIYRRTATGWTQVIGPTTTIGGPVMGIGTMLPATGTAGDLFLLTRPVPPPPVNATLTAASTGGNPEGFGWNDASLSPGARGAITPAPSGYLRGIRWNGGRVRVIGAHGRGGIATGSTVATLTIDGSSHTLASASTRTLELRASVSPNPLTVGTHTVQITFTDTSAATRFGLPSGQTAVFVGAATPAGLYRRGASSWSLYQDTLGVPSAITPTFARSGGNSFLTLTTTLMRTGLTSLTGRAIMPIAAQAITGNASRWPKDKLPADIIYTAAQLSGVGTAFPTTPRANDFFLLWRGLTRPPISGSSLTVTQLSSNIVSRADWLGWYTQDPARHSNPQTSGSLSRQPTNGVILGIYWFGALRRYEVVLSRAAGQALADASIVGGIATLTIGGSNIALTKRRPSNTMTGPTDNSGTQWRVGDVENVQVTFTSAAATAIGLPSGQTKVFPDIPATPFASGIYRYASGAWGLVPTANNYVTGVSHSSTRDAMNRTLALRTTLTRQGLNSVTDSENLPIAREAIMGNTDRWPLSKLPASLAGGGGTAFPTSPMAQDMFLLTRGFRTTTTTMNPQGAATLTVGRGGGQFTNLYGWSDLTMIGPASIARFGAISPSPSYSGITAIWYDSTEDRYFVSLSSAATTALASVPPFNLAGWIVIGGVPAQGLSLNGTRTALRSGRLTTSPWTTVGATPTVQVYFGSLLTTPLGLTANVTSGTYANHFRVFGGSATFTTTTPSGLYRYDGTEWKAADLTFAV